MAVAATCGGTSSPHVVNGSKPPRRPGAGKLLDTCRAKRSGYRSPEWCATGRRLQDARLACPAGDIALEESRKLIGAGRKFPGAIADLVKFQVHDRIDQSGRAPGISPDQQSRQETSA